MYINKNKKKQFMKKKLTILTAVAMMIAVVSCKEKDKNVPVIDVTLNEITATMTIGDTLTLTATVLPEKATNKAITWTSTDTAVATVTNGQVIAKGVGTTDIMVTTEDGNKTATCNITVNPISVTSVLLNPTTATLFVGDMLTLTETVLPTNATNQVVTWSSSNTNVATVADGVVTTLSVGTVTITVTTQDGNKTATCNITVNPISVTSVSLNPTTAALFTGDTIKLIETILPTNATNQVVTWSSNNTNVATVVNGVVRAISVGTAIITVTTQDGNKTATCNITVTERPPLVIPTCNTLQPGWGSNLGIVSFASSTQHTISGNGITQIWSDAVQSTNCNKTSFADALPNNYHADCRSNPGQKGDFFSWCAVVRYQHTLCPAPWRVPTQQDFMDLDIALGGDGYGSNDPILRNKYLSDWGGTYGGMCISSDWLDGQGSAAYYWSQSVDDINDMTWTLYFNSNGDSTPQYPISKTFGVTLRCVR